MRYDVGRVSVEASLGQVPRPQVAFADEGDGFRYVAVSLGGPFSDPIASLELDLGGPWIGRLLDRFVYRRRHLQWAQRKAERNLQPRRSRK